MKNFIEKIKTLIKSHKIVSAIVGGIIFVGIALCIILPIALSNTGADVYTVNFYIDSNLYSSDKVEKGKKVAEPETPVESHKTFDAWYLDKTFATLFDFSAPITKNMDAYGKFNTEQLTISFYEVVDGSYKKLDPMTRSIDYNSVLTEPTAPTKVHYTFTKWYSNHELTSEFDFSKPITANTTLYGKYVKQGTYTLENGTVYDWGELISGNNIRVSGSTLTGSDLSTLGSGTLVLNDSIEKIGAHAFKDSKIKSIVLPDSVTEIQYEAFMGSLLESIDLPNTLLSIGGGAFANTQLKELKIPSSLTSLGSKILDGQGENLTLKKLTAPLIGLFTYNCFGFFFGADEYAQNASKVPSSLKEVVLTEVKDNIIPEKAFSECGNIEKITIKGSIKGISRYAFENCTSLKEIVLEDGIESIYPYILSGCSSLTSLDIPETLTSIASYAFYGIDNLKEVSIKSTSEIFNDNYSFINLFGVSDITTDNGVEYIKKSIKKVIIKDSSTEIPNDFFYYGGRTSAHFAIEEIIVGKNVKTIGDYAFKSCGYMTKISLPEGPLSIGRESFARCKSLEEIDLPSTLTSIGYEAFLQCYSLKSITIPSSVTSFGTCVFLSCKALKTVTFLSDDIEIIGERCFSDCGSLTSITLPKNLKTIGYQAFSGCINLTEIHLPDTITRIYKEAFSCTGVVDGSYATIYPIEKIYFNGTIEQWNKIEIYQPSTNEIFPISRISDVVGECIVICTDGSITVG